MENEVNAETATDKPFYEVEVTTERGEIVKKLNGICNQLLKWGYSHHPANLGRCSFFRAAVYATSVQLQALKDREIDELAKEIEAIKARLEMKT